MANIRVYGLRHGDAPKAESRARAIDLARPLSPVGIRQGEIRAGTFSRTHFTRICCSPAERALMTAERATGRSRQDEDFYVLPELYTPEGPDGEVLDRMYYKLGHQPPSAYFEHEPYPGFIEKLSRTAGESIDACLWRKPSVDGAPPFLMHQTVLVAGHAVFVPLAVHGLLGSFSVLSEEVTKFLHGLDMDEAGAFCIAFNTGNPSAVQMTNFG